MKYYYICVPNKNYDTGSGEWSRYSYIYTYKELIATLVKNHIDNFTLNMNDIRIEYISEFEYVKKYCIIVYENDDWYNLSEEQLEAIKRDIYKYKKKNVRGYWITTNYLISKSRFRKDPIYRTGKRKHEGRGCASAGIMYHIRMNTDVDYLDYRDNEYRVYNLCKFDRYRKQHVRSWKQQYKIRKQWMIHLK